MHAKTLTLALVPLLAALLPLAAPAAATHGPHGACGDSTFSVGNTVRVDVWANNACAGATVYSILVACALGRHLHTTSGVHVLVLYDNGCETGALAPLP